MGAAGGAGLGGLLGIGVAPGVDAASWIVISAAALFGAAQGAAACAEEKPPPDEL